MPWNIWHRMTACLLLCAGMSLTGCCGPSRPEPIRPPASLLREGPPLPSPVPVYEAIKAATDEEGRLRAALHFVGYVNPDSPWTTFLWIRPKLPTGSRVPVRHPVPAPPAGTMP